MNIEDFRSYCLAKKGVEECFPFDEVTLVFKVMGKMFALVGLDNEPLKANLKCDPVWAVDLRDQYPEEILPGYHMHKQQWNTVIIDGTLSDKMLCQLIDHSYELVVQKLTRKDRETLANL